jgi:lipopolysaccharide export system protein LptC
MSLATRSAIIFPLALLSMLAVLTFWINKSVQPPAAKLDGSSRHDPDYIMSNFVTTQTDSNGDLYYKLAAVEMKHFPDDDSTDLQRPRYTQFAIGKPYTQVESLRGYVSSNGEEVQLVDNVIVTRQAFADKGEMTVETDYLKILPKQELASTESPVVIRQAPKTVIYATGMVYEKKNRTVTLLHNVRAHYEKPGMQSNTAKTTDKAVSVNSKTLSNPTANTNNSVVATKQATNKQATNSKSAQSSTTQAGIPPSNTLESSTMKSNTNESNTTESNSNDARIRRRYE